MKKSLALMLALIMVLCMIPTTAFAEAGDWNPLTNPDDVKGEFAGNRSFTASTTMEAGKDGYLRLMPTLDIGNYTYNAMAYCGATATSNNTSIVEVKSIEIGKWVGGEWNDAHCLQVTVNPKAAGTTTVVINFYYTFSQSANPLTNPKAQWFYGTSNYTINVTEPTKPTKPSANDIPGIVGNGAVKVHCTNAKANHANDKSYGLMPNSYTVSEVEGNAKNGYTCTITVQSEKYVNDYNASINVNHKLDGSSTGTIKLKWNETDKKWEVVSALPVVFDVKCETTQPPTDKPEPPKPDNTPAIPGLTELNEVVKVKCKTAPKSHEGKTFGFNWFSCQVGEVINDNNEYFCTITVLPDEYVTTYNVMHYPGHTHTLDPDGQKDTLRLKWNATAKQWENTESAKLPITFTVKCDTVEPTKPDKPGESVILDLINKINVQCIANTDPKHPEKDYDPIAGSYTVGEVEGNPQSGYTCTVTIVPDKYVEKYNADVTGANHTLAAGEGNKTVKLKYDSANDEWKVDIGMPVVFKVQCDNTQPPLDPITIEVSKKWEDDIAGAQSITVGLYANGIKVKNATIRPDNEGTWFHRFNDMPKNDSNGNLINYTVKEENVPAGWTPYYWTADKLIFRIHNVPTENTREIKVTKKVSGEGADKEKYFDFKVTLFQDLDGNGEIGVGTHPLSDTYTFGGVTFTNGVATFKLKDGDSKEITGIPSHVQYLPLLYKVEEIVPDGYTVKVNGSAGSSINGDFTGTNAKTVNIAFENIKGSGTNPTPTPTPNPTPGGGNGGGGHWHPTTTPVPVIVIPPKTGDMTIWQSILHFLGIR